MKIKAFCAEMCKKYILLYYHNHTWENITILREDMTNKVKIFAENVSCLQRVFHSN